MATSLLHIMPHRISKKQMTDQCLFIIKLIILELYVCNGDIEKLPTQHLENFENKKLQ